MSTSRFLLALCFVGACSKPQAPAELNAATPRGPRPDADTMPFRQCAQDGDCVQVRDGCCDCSQGNSRMIAVATSQKEAFEATNDCRGTMCLEMFGSCNRGTVACEQGVCRFHELPPK